MNAISKSQSAYKTLIRRNIAALVLHAVQAVTMVWLVAFLGTEKSYDITAYYLTFDAATQTLVPATETLFSVDFAWLVASFLVMSSIAHLTIVTIYRKRYLADLERGVNRARWIEYSVSASTMMVAIALLSGMNDGASLLMVFGLVAVMNLTGLVMELVNVGRKTISWVGFVVGCVAGIIPWIAFALYVWAAESFGASDIPAFVYGIYVSIFVFFNCFAVNMYLQYKKIGPWKNYLFGENVYIILSLVAKSALAWQVFGGVFRP